MPNIKKASALRNYSAVLDEVETGSPVFLMREGSSGYAIMDMDEYDALREGLWDRLFGDIDYSRSIAANEGWLTVDEVTEQMEING